MNNKVVASILEYAKLLSKEKLCKLGDTISVRAGEKMYTTNPKVELGKATDKDIKVVEYQNGGSISAKVFATRQDVNVVLHTHPNNICVVSNAHISIPAVLDDMAQIVGVNAKISKNNESAILKALKGRNSILICDDGAINTGRTLNEAYAGCLVLEKSAMVFIGGSVLGGCKVINPIEARLMRFVYKTKYSKKNQENLAREER